MGHDQNNEAILCKSIEAIYLVVSKNKQIGDTLETQHFLVNLWHICLIIFAMHSKKRHITLSKYIYFRFVQLLH